MRQKIYLGTIMVHTPTKAESGELLRILHGCGYEWSDHKPLTCNTYWETYGEDTVYIACAGLVDKTDMSAQHEWRGHNPVYTFAQFKEIFCAMTEQSTEIMSETSVTSDKPQPKFKVGDKVRVINDCGCNACGLIGVVEDVATRSVNVTCDDIELSCLYEWIEPYTEPETKEETMETKENRNLSQDVANCDKSECKELNLCELLKGHEGGAFYSPICGTDIELKEVFKSYLVFYLDKDDDCTIECETRGWQRIGTLDDCGTFKSITYPDSACLIYPSRALYEQYPLDPYTAWMKWQESNLNARCI